MSASEAKSGKYTYYVCQSLMERDSGTSKTPRLNAKKIENTIVDELRANILTESNIRDLVMLLDEEMDGAAREERQKLESIEAELEEVKKQLGRVWQFISKRDSIDMAAASDHIVALRERKESMESAPDEARAVLAERRQYLDSADTIAAFVEEMSEFLTTSELTETKAFVHSFVKEIRVKPGRAAIIYSMPTPDDSQLGGADSAEIAINGGVRKSVRHGGPGGTRTHDLRIKSPLLFRPSYQSAPGLRGSERQRPRPRPPNALTLTLRIRHRTHWCGYCEVDLRVDNPYGSETSLGRERSSLTITTSANRSGVASAR